MRIGIFGGSFDPVHRQHLQIALAALIECSLDEVWFVPVFHAVHKPGQKMLDYHHRRHLLQTAMRDLPGGRICDIEQELGGPSYTCRTMELLNERFPDRKFLLIIGGDSLKELPGWKNPEKLVQLTEFIVVDRPGFEVASPLPDAIVHRVPCQTSPMSSTKIRAALQRHQFNLPELDFDVLMQILLHDHYGCLGEDFRHWLKLVADKQKESPDGLQEHMCSATRLAVKYALDLGIDPRPALVAGMAHDLFRSAPDAEIIGLAGSTSFILTELEKETPMLAHGAAAAAWLLKVAPAIDAGIVSAVKNHTFPRPDSPVLTKILATADTLDPVRQIPERDRIRESELSFEERYRQVLELKKTSHL